MSFSHKDEPLVHNLGGGDDKPIRLVTDGQARMLVRGDSPVFEFAKVTSDPDAGKGARLFFRLDELSKWQLCVQFPSGVFQVVVTEP
jgi:hypothetical protein